MNLAVKLLVSVNVFLYRLTGGVVGAGFGRNFILLLTTKGRKSGKIYTIPLNYFQDAHNYVIVASNFGRDSHPSWFLNLMHQTGAAIQIKSRVIQVAPHAASGEEYDRLWRIVIAQNAFYADYKKKAKRQIPLIVLTPLE